MAPAIDPSVPPPRPATVRELLAYGDLPSFMAVHTGAGGVERPILHARIQKSGLALAGHTRGIVPARVQILGDTELSFLDTLDPPTRRERAAVLFDLGLSCVIVTRGVEPPPEIVEHASRTGTPLVTSTYRSSRTIALVHSALDDILAPRTELHGVMVDVHGVGVLLLGPSGIGKSECALVLVERGHRFVADDTVLLRRLTSGEVEATAPPLLENHLEVRGIGILNLRDLFGATAVRTRKRLELVVELVPFERGEPYERLGVEDRMWTVFDRQIPMLRIPVSAGRDMGLIVEVAARNQLLRMRGDHSARAFLERLSAGLGVPNPGPKEGA